MKDWKLTPTRRPTITVDCSASPLPSTMNRTKCKYDRIAKNENRVKYFIVVTGVIKKSDSTFKNNLVYQPFHLSNLIISHYVTVGMIGCKINLPFL